MFKHALCAAGASLLLSAISFADPDKILIATKGSNSHLLASKVAAPYGKVVRKDMGLYEIALKSGIKPAKAITALKKNRTIMYAFDASVRNANTTSLKSVRDYIAYLEACDILMPKDEEMKNGRREVEVDYWRAWEFYLSRRAGPDGQIDVEAYRDAVQHRNNMEAAVIGAASDAQAPGGSWSYVGPKNLDIPYRTYYGVRPLSGRLGAIAIAPQSPNTIYVGAAGGGVHKSTDGGVTWIPRSDGWDFMQVSSIAIDPTDANVVYVGTGDHHGGPPYTMGIMKSTNGGSTWTQLGNAEFGNAAPGAQGAAVARILIDPANTQIVHAITGRGAVGNGRIWRSTNGGLTWALAVSTANVALPATRWNDASIGTNRIGGRYYWVTGQNQVWRSNNQGATWTAITMPAGASSGGTSAIAASKRTTGNGPTTAYYLSPANNAVYRTLDAGATWTNITGNHPKDRNAGDNYNWSQDGYDYHIGTQSVTINGVQQDLVVTGLITVAHNLLGDTTWKDSGITYTSGALTHNDQHCFATDPSNPNTMYVGGDGGIFRATYNSAADTFAFTPLNRSLYTTQFYKMALHPTDTDWVMGGTQDNATPASLGDLSNWGNPGGGDGGWCGIQSNNPANQFYTTQRASYNDGTSGLSVARTGNSWGTEVDITRNVGNESTAFIPPVTYGTGGHAGTIWGASDHLYKWNGVWTRFPQDLGSVVDVLAVSPSYSTRIYSGARDGQVWMTSDGGPTWKRIDAGVPDSPIGAISVRSNFSADVLVGLSSTSGTQNLWRCSNTEAATPTWTNVSGSGASALPNVPINAIERDPHNLNTWYVGTDIGVFMTSNGGSTWSNATEPLGLPNVGVNDLKYHASSGYLYAATWGRGIWRIRLVALSMHLLSLPTYINGGFSGVGYGYLNGYAPSNTYYSLSSNNSAACSVPSVGLVPAGKTSGSFSMTTNRVLVDTVVTITASLGGESRTDEVVVRRSRPRSVTMTPNPVEGGFNANGIVQMWTPVFQDTTVTLTDNTTSISTPASVVIPKGSSSAAFAMQTLSVSADVTRQVTATFDSVSAVGSITLRRGGLLSFAINPNQVVGGSKTTGVVTLTGPAPAGGSQVEIITGSTAITAPSPVTVNAGLSQVSFEISTAATRTTYTRYLQAKRGNVTRTAALTVAP